MAVIKTFQDMFFSFLEVRHCSRDVKAHTCIHRSCEGMPVFKLIILAFGSLSENLSAGKGHI